MEKSRAGTEVIYIPGNHDDLIRQFVEHKFGEIQIMMDDIHIKAELGRYRMRGFSLFKKIPHWDDLTFLPGTLTRFVIEGYREKCETKTVIGPRAVSYTHLTLPTKRIV